jgi:hypothetical protein
MKKILLSTILCFLFSISLNAQSKSDVYQGKISTVKSQQSSVSSFHSDNDAVSMEWKFVGPSKQSEKMKISNTPIENAGTYLKNAGRMMYWGTIATVVGQVLTLAGEPATGSLISICGTVIIWSGYQNITKAGRLLEQSGNN